MQRQRLEESGIIFPPRYERSPYHAEVSAVWLHKQLERHEPDIAGELTWVLRDAMGGHHGRFIQEDARDLGRRLRASEKGGTSQREEWRAELIRRMEASEVVPTHVGVNRLIGFGDFTTKGCPHALPKAAQKRDLALQLLKQVPVLWVWDNVEQVAGFPVGTPSVWTDAEQREFAAFLREARQTRAKVLLTSRREERGNLAHTLVLDVVGITDSGPVGRGYHLLLLRYHRRTSVPAIPEHGGQWISFRLSCHRACGSILNYHKHGPLLVDTGISRQQTRAGYYTPARPNSQTYRSSRFWYLR